MTFERWMFVATVIAVAVFVMFEGQLMGAWHIFPNGHC